MEGVINDTVLPALLKLEKEIATNGGTVSVKDKVGMHEIILNGIADGMTQATYRCDVHGKCIWSNHALQRMFGLSGGDMIHFGWASVIDPADREGVVAKWLSCIATGAPYEASYHIINALSGAKLRVKTYANPMRHAVDNHIIIWSGSVVVEDRGA